MLLCYSIKVKQRSKEVGSSSCDAGSGITCSSSSDEAGAAGTAEESTSNSLDSMASLASTRSRSRVISAAAQTSSAEAKRQRRRRREVELQRRQQEEQLKPTSAGEGSPPPTSSSSTDRKNLSKRVRDEKKKSADEKKKSADEKKKSADEDEIQGETELKGEASTSDSSEVTPTPTPVKLACRGRSTTRAQRGRPGRLPARPQPRLDQSEDRSSSSEASSKPPRFRRRDQPTNVPLKAGLNMTTGDESSSSNIPLSSVVKSERPITISSSHSPIYWQGNSRTSNANLSASQSVIITDVTAHRLTITVRESQTDKGFFKNRRINSCSNPPPSTDENECDE